MRDPCFIAQLFKPGPLLQVQCEHINEEFQRYKARAQSVLKKKTVGRCSLLFCGLWNAGARLCLLFAPSSTSELEVLKHPDRGHIQR